MMVLITRFAPAPVAAKLALGLATRCLCPRGGACVASQRPQAFSRAITIIRRTRRLITSMPPLEARPAMVSHRIVLPLLVRRITAAIIIIIIITGPRPVRCMAPFLRISNSMAA
jgi:hypothetical protein